MRRLMDRRGVDFFAPNKPSMSTLPAARVCLEPAPQWGVVLLRSAAKMVWPGDIIREERGMLRSRHVDGQCAMSPGQWPRCVVSLRIDGLARLGIGP